MTLRVQRSAEHLRDLLARLERKPRAYRFQVLGRAFIEAGLLDGAETALIRSSTLAPAEPWTQLYLGHVAFASGRYRHALDVWRHAHTLAPDLAMPLVCMADALEALGDDLAAGEHYLKATELEPDSDIAHDNLQRWVARQRSRRFGGLDRPGGSPNSA